MKGCQHVYLHDLDSLAGTDCDVQGSGWRSRRLVLADSGLGYSLHDTTMFAGTELAMHYKNHIESVYCISGEAEVVDDETGEVHPISPGTLYVLDQHDRHTFRAKTEVRNICVFKPALTGGETHDEDGSYPPPER